METRPDTTQPSFIKWVQSQRRLAANGAHSHNGTSPWRQIRNDQRQNNLASFDHKIVMLSLLAIRGWRWNGQNLHIPVGGDADND